VEQLFRFAPRSEPRVADLSLRVAAIVRPQVNSITVTVGAGQPVTLPGRLFGADGEEWDDLGLSVLIPPGVATVRVQLISPPVAEQRLVPASITWVGAGLSLRNQPPPRCQTGLDARFWRWAPDAWQATGRQPGEMVSEVFAGPLGFPGSVRGVLRDPTLRQALSYDGGPVRIAIVRLLLREATASLLNASHPQVQSFPLSPPDVIRAVSFVLNSGDPVLQLDSARLLRRANARASLCR
jgi:hypothetical protein